MTRYRYDKKRTICDLLQLSIGWLQKHKYTQKDTIKSGSFYWKSDDGMGNMRQIGAVNFLSNFIGENRFIELSYFYNKKEEIKTQIQIVITHPNFGGERQWFVCPQCGRKVAFLYEDKYFLCRHCHDLCYRVQQVGLMDRLMEKSIKYKKRVQVNDNKKRWLHWKTYYEMMEKSYYYESEAFLMAYKTLEKYRLKVDE